MPHTLHSRGRLDRQRNHGSCLPCLSSNDGNARPRNDVTHIGEASASKHLHTFLNRRHSVRPPLKAPRTVERPRHCCWVARVVHQISTTLQAEHRHPNGNVGTLGALENIGKAMNILAVDTLRCRALKDKSSHCFSHLMCVF